MTSSFIPVVSSKELAKERAKAREVRASQWWKRKKSQGICYYCEKQFKPSELTMDHKVPLIRGGKSTKGNVVPACKPCNTDKKNKLLMEWDQYLKEE